MGLEPAGKFPLPPGSHFLYTGMMVSKSIPVETKKRGRPPGQAFPVSIPVRFAEDQVAGIDAAASAEPDKPSRSELIRRIVMEWLKAKGMLG